MDPLAHASLGAVAAALFSRRRDSVRTAVVAGALGALAPDLDVLIRSKQDPLLSLEFHRHFSHALLFAPVIGVLVGGLFRWVRRKSDPPPEFRRLWIWATIGAATAGLLDACTSYGTHLLWPVSGERVAWNLVAVVDPVLTLGLLIGLAFVFFRRDSRRGSKITIGFVAVFFGCAGWQKSRIETARDALLVERGHVATAGRMLVKPTLGNLLLWRSVYEHDGEFFVDAIRVGPFSKAKIYEGNSIAAEDVESLAAEFSEKSEVVRDIERFARFSDGYLVRHPDHPEVIADPRYAMLPNSVLPLWGIRIAESDSEVPIRWENFRRSDPEFREKFLGMLLGR